MTIGELPWGAVLSHATRLADAGGAPVPPLATGLRDLQPSGPGHVRAISQAAGKTGGAILMSSGGTTGTPKLTYVPFHQALSRLAKEWRPVRPGDVLLNLFNPGRMWASHYYMHALAQHSGCVVIPSGPFASEEVRTWVAMFNDVRVNALAGTPTALADFAAGVLDAGMTLPIRTMIWMADRWTEKKLQMVREAFPYAGLWGNYGSVETYVIATNTPECEFDVLHLLAEQLLELDDQGALLTRVGPEWTIPLVRYRLGDRLSAASCRCGRAMGLRVLGRADDAVKLRSALFSVGEILDAVRRAGAVEDAQLIFRRSGDAPGSADAVCVDFVGPADPEALRHKLLQQFFHLAAIEGKHPGTVTARRVERLKAVERTTKIPPAMWTDT